MKVRLNVNTHFKGQSYFKGAATEVEEATGDRWIKNGIASAAEKGKNDRKGKGKEGD